MCALALSQVALLVDAVPTIIATPLGGCLSDKFATRGAGVTSSSRLVPNTLTLLALGPAGTLGAGWALQYGAHIGILLAAVGATAFGGYFWLPGLFSYITTVKQSTSASATAGAQSLMTLAAGLVVIMTAVARKSLGYGWWFTILASVQFVLTAAAYCVIVREQRAHNRANLHLPPDHAAADRADVP